MIPILYEKTETNFDSNGVGRLGEAVSCVVVEERNGMYELSMQYPTMGRLFDQLEVDAYIKAVPFHGGNPQIFRIYAISKPLGGVIEINANHISYQMKFIPVMPFSANTPIRMMESMKENATEPCPFEMWTDMDDEVQFNLNYPDEMRGKLQGDTWSILQALRGRGGEYEWDNFTVKLWRARGQDKGVLLRYGKNITDIKQEENIENTYTGIVPYWYKDDNNTKDLLYLPEITMYSDNVDNFPYKRTITVDFSEEWEEKPTVEQLRSRGHRYIRENRIGIPNVNIDVTFVDLAETEEYKDILPIQTVNLCDTVTVIFDELGIAVKEKVTRTEWNVLLERYDSIHVGGDYTSLASEIAEQSVEIEANKTETASSITRAAGSALQKANAYTDTVATGAAQTAVSAYDETLNQQNIFNRLTNDGQVQGIYLEDQKVYINASYIQSGIFRVRKGEQDTFYANCLTGEVNIVANSFSLTSGDTIESIAEGAADGALEDAKVYADGAAGDALSTAKGYADGKVTGLDETLTQQNIFNRLTDDGQTQGIYLQNKKLYINASYIQSGIFRVQKNGTDTFYANCLTGEVNIVANSFSLTSGDTIYSIADDAADDALSDAKSYADTKASGALTSAKSYSDSGDSTTLASAKSYSDTGDGTTLASAKSYSDTGDSTTLASAKSYADGALDDYDDALTQQKVFNRLTNDGQTQGIYLSNGKVYINASYISSGYLSATRISGGTLESDDSNSNFKLNMSTGALTAKRLSVSSTNFTLTESGTMTAYGAYVSGTMRSTGSNGYWAELGNGYANFGDTSHSSSAGYIVGRYSSTSGGGEQGTLSLVTDSIILNAPRLFVNTGSGARGGGSGSITVNGVQLTFVNGLLITALS